MKEHLLSVLIFAPLAAAAVAAAIANERVLRWWALLSSLAIAALSVPLYTGYLATQTGFQFVEHCSWIPSLKIDYHLGVDGISVLLILLTTLITPICVACSWTYISKRVKEFMVCMLVMEAAMIGVFSALDLVLFYIFWEAMLIPMTLLIGVWGGARKIYAALKFFIYTMAGSVMLLVAIVALRLQVGTFSIPDMMAAGSGFGHSFQLWIFGAFFLSFAIKVPMFPFHTWLPAAHVEAPTAGSVVLASVLLKMGTYGFLRFCLPITPHAAHTFAPVVLVFSVIAIVYGGLAALGQSDLKKLVAYSSVAHMGFATFGIFSFTQSGLEGATLVMINHGVTTGALFVCVGILYERLHTRDIGVLAGVGKYMPVFSTFLGLACLSSMAFPGTNSFVGEFLVMVAGFSVSKTLMLCAVPGIVAAAAYNLRMLQKVCYGTPNNRDYSAIADLNLREILTLAPLAVFIVWIGFHPQPFLDVMRDSLAHVLAQLGR